MEKKNTLSVFFYLCQFKPSFDDAVTQLHSSQSLIEQEAYPTQRCVRNKNKNPSIYSLYSSKPIKQARTELVPPSVRPLNLPGSLRQTMSSTAAKGNKKPANNKDKSSAFLLKGQFAVANGGILECLHNMVNKNSHGEMGRGKEERRILFFLYAPLSSGTVYRVTPEIV